MTYIERLWRINNRMRSSVLPNELLLSGPLYIIIRKNNVLSANKRSGKQQTAVSVAFSYLRQCRVKTGQRLLLFKGFQRIQQKGEELRDRPIGNQDREKIGKAEKSQKNQEKSDLMKGFQQSDKGGIAKSQLTVSLYSH